MIFTEIGSQRPLLDELYVQDEVTLLEKMLGDLLSLQSKRSTLSDQAVSWICAVREMRLPTFNVQRFLIDFPLTHPEGRSLMALSEALLRIPDGYTANLLLTDTLLGHAWNKQGAKGDALLGLSRWGLDFASFIQNKPWAKMARPVSLGVFKIFMRLLAREFIIGRSIQEASKRRHKDASNRYSFDMLGEGARTFSAAKTYLDTYRNAIETLGKQKGRGDNLSERDSISIKLSALHPHYTVAHRDQVMKDLTPILIELCVLARAANIGLTIDAEEASRLELSLDLIETLCHATELEGWQGLGFAVQAYQKRAPGVIDWAEALATQTKRTLMIRLVKGAYWDTEVKLAQIGGYPAYPVFTRKATTDLSYLYCAKKLLKAEGILYPQFATHNAYTVAAVLEMAKGREDIEFQRLQGMGEELYAAVRATHPVACRVYAPVGKDQDLLPYLVRRLLENGANSSFVHKIYDKFQAPEEVVGDPWGFFEGHTLGAHPEIPLPSHLYGASRENSQGYDLSDKKTLEGLKKEIEAHKGTYGKAPDMAPDDVETALQIASAHWESWDLTPVTKRAEILYRAADLLEERQGLFLGLLMQEGKKTLPDAIAELREAVDFCRYYGVEALKHYGAPQDLKGPTGERNQLILRARGVFASISPWNFPLAIFIGPVAAALGAGNAVIAKPASQTPLIAFHAVQVLLDAGVPREVLHFIHGRGSVVSAPLLGDLRINGVVFTGSTGTAQHIQRTLTERGGPFVPFIAETGGLNAMIVDSSALIEQVVDEVIVSAFQSAGQRCSCLRILFIQEDIYASTVQMLKEAMEALTVADSEWLSTDVGPVIDEAAQTEIESYIAGSQPLARTPLIPLEGTFVAPTLIEIGGMADLTKEIFGPVLHVASFKGPELDQLIDSINESGYGLTLGIQSRVESNIRKICARARVGNIYVNRSMIGAVVGVQPFGGEGLSGTGPKAGGPHYLPCFGTERVISTNITASGGNVALMNLGE